MSTAHTKKFDEAFQPIFESVIDKKVRTLDWQCIKLKKWKLCRM